MKLLSAKPIPTPFGTVHVPDIDTPPLRLPSAPTREGLAAIKHGIGSDLALVVGLVPIVGDVVADILEDLHEAEIHRILSKEHYERYKEYNKTLPSSIALARIYMFKEK